MLISLSEILIYFSEISFRKKNNYPLKRSNTSFNNNSLKRNINSKNNYRVSYGLHTINLKKKIYHLSYRE